MAPINGLLVKKKKTKNQIPQAVLVFEVMACSLLFSPSENACHPNPDVVQLDFLPDFWQRTSWVKDEVREASAPRSKREGGACLPA